MGGDRLERVAPHRLSRHIRQFLSHAFHLGNVTVMQGINPLACGSA
jgi:hypothetical protein